MRPGGVRRRASPRPPTSPRGSGTASRPPAPRAHSFTLLHDTERGRVPRPGRGAGQRHDAAGRHLRRRRGGAARRRGRRPGARRGPARLRRPGRAGARRCAPSSTRSAPPTPGSWSPATSTSTRSPRSPRRRSTATASAPRWSPAAATRPAASSTSWSPREDADGEMVSVAKKSKDKISIGGRKYALRRRDAARRRRGRGGRHRRRRPPTTATTGRCWCRWCADGEVVGREPLDAARERHVAARDELPMPTRQMSQGRARARHHPPLTHRCDHPGTLAAPVSRYATVAHEARTDRRRRPERLLRGRHPAGRRRSRGRARDRRAPAPLVDAGRRRRPDYAHVVATQDHHIDPGAHFVREPDFVDSWPPHCVVGTDGEAFHPNLDPQPFDAIFLKGEYAAAYSGFEGRTTDGVAPRRLAARARGHRRRRLRHRHRLLRAGHRPGRASARASRCACCPTCARAWPRRPPRSALSEMAAAGVRV